MEYTTPFHKPGLHSHNLQRQKGEAPRIAAPVRRLRRLLLIAGLLCLGYYAYTLANEYVYQVYANWVFDQQTAGRLVTFGDYLRERTPFGFLAGTAAKPATITAPSKRTLIPADGSIIGRVTVERLHLSAMVRQGVGQATLSDSVGHVPSSALPGQDGNLAIAAHRDTLFRALKDIKLGDTVDFETSDGIYRYQVAGTGIVRPTNVSVLHADGGGIIEPDPGLSSPQILTMITCYPFYYVGSAPKRFIVEARLVSHKTNSLALNRP